MATKKRTKKTQNDIAAIQKSMSRILEVYEDLDFEGKLALVTVYTVATEALRARFAKDLNILGVLDKARQKGMKP